MFNLEQAIAEWRRRMLTAGIKTPVPLEELDIHLREDVERQMKSGMNRQEAFDFAIQQIGQAGTLRKEFGKVGEVMSARWRKFNFAICGVVAILFGLTGVTFLFPKSPSVSFHERLSVSGAFVSVALIFWSWRFTYGFFPVLSKRMRIIVSFLCIIMSCLCAVLVLHLVLPSVNSIDQLNHASVQVIAEAAWIMLLPLSLAVSIIYALEEAAYRKTAMSDL
jgi:membrane protease YdiL (CAAX protease family)